MLGDRVNNLIEVAVQALEQAGIRYAITGGVGMILNGRERFTRDIDVVVVAEDKDMAVLKEQARSLGFAHMDRADRHPLEGLMLYRFWLPIENTGLSQAFDVQQGMTAFHDSIVARAHPMRLGSQTVQVASPEDMTLLKLSAYRPIDRADAIELLRGNSASLDRAYLDQWASALQVADRLAEAWAAAEGPEI